MVQRSNFRVSSAIVVQIGAPRTDGRANESSLPCHPAPAQGRLQSGGEGRNKTNRLVRPFVCAHGGVVSSARQRLLQEAVSRGGAAHVDKGSPGVTTRSGSGKTARTGVADDRHRRPSEGVVCRSIIHEAIGIGPRNVPVNDTEGSLSAPHSHVPRFGPPYLKRLFARGCKRSPAAA